MKLRVFLWKNGHGASRRSRFIYFAKGTGVLLFGVTFGWKALYPIYTYVLLELVV